MKRHVLLPCLSLTILLILSACSLLPQEKQRREAPIQQQESGSIYAFTPVRQGPVTQTVRATTSVRPTLSHELAFSVSDAAVAATFVTVGTQVKEGEELARLDTAELERQIQDLQTQTALKDLERSYQKELDAIAIDRANLELQRAGSAAARAGQQEAVASLQKAAQAKEEQLGVEYEALSLELSRLEERLAGSVLVADMDGIVTKISSDRRSFTISDLSECLLRIDAKNASDFPVGTEVTVEHEGAEEICTVLSPSQAGVEEDGCRYLRPMTLALSAASRCSASFVAAQEENTVYVSAAAIREEDGKDCVYLLGDDGLMTIQPVEIGIRGDGVVQILSGLEAGQEVILSY